jgi:hypothetical protein
LILLKASQLDNFLDPRRPQKDFHRADERFYDELVEFLKRNAPKIAGFRYGFEPLWVLLKPELVRVMKKGTFKERVFADLGNELTKSGRRGPNQAINRTAFEDMKSILAAGVRTTVTNFRKRQEDDLET